MAPHFKNDLNIYNELMHLSELIPTIYSLLLSKLSQSYDIHWSTNVQRKAGDFPRSSIVYNLTSAALPVLSAFQE